MSDKILVKNKAASYNYEIVDKYEAGIKLTGPEVKAIKQGMINLNGSYATVQYDAKHNPRLVLLNCKISRYRKSGYAQENYDPLRPRQLLLHKRELSNLIGKLGGKGLTLIPFSVYTKRRLIKLEIALVKGKSQRDKREQIKKRDIDKRIRQKLRA
ncbi:MAG: SsrA-binding protein SmpB [Candidatus Komeilibacteria bacterium]